MAAEAVGGILHGARLCIPIPLLPGDGVRVAADGSRARVSPSSLAKLSPGRKRGILEVIAPTAVFGVRDIRYRASFDKTAYGRTRIEVVDSYVRFDAAAGPAGPDMAGGFGADRVASELIRLLGAHELAELAKALRTDDRAFHA